MLVAEAPAMTTGPADDAAARTVGELLGDGIARLRAAGCEAPRLDAELLLGWAAGLDRTTVIAHPGRGVEPGAVARWEAAIGRRERGEPLAYIRAEKEFHGRTLRVDARALIPRPETELLVELALREAAARLGRDGLARLRIVDVGAGSGAIALAVAATLRDRDLADRVEILATDASHDALDLAATNLAEHGLAGLVRLAAADLLPPGEPAFDLVLANLPYIPAADVPHLPVALSFEPPMALTPGPDGLALIRRLLALLPVALSPGGLALLEIGSDQGGTIGPAIEAALPGWAWRLEPDLAGLPRLAVVRRPAGSSAPLGAS